MVTTRGLEWAAGFLDGEGCFRYGSTAPQIVCAQVSRELLDKLDGIIGPGVFWLVDNSKKNPNWKPCWYWELNGSKAIQAMMTLWVLLSTKRKSEIETVLAKWKTKRVRLPNGMNMRNPNSPFFRGINYHRTKKEQRP